MLYHQKQHHEQYFGVRLQNFPEFQLGHLVNTDSPPLAGTAREPVASQVYKNLFSRT